MGTPLSASRNPTMVDIARGKVDGKWDRDIVELALESTENLGHFVVLPCNNGHNDTTTIRTGIPEATWVQYYEGVQPSKGQKKQVTNSCGRMKGLVQVDKDLINSEEDAKNELGDEAFAMCEGMGMEVLSTVYYGNTKVNGRKFNGLSPIYSLAGKETETDDKTSKYYTIACKRKDSSPSASALRSIWLIGHGRMGTALLYPRGTSAGLTRGPVKDQTVTTEEGKRLEVKEQFFDWWCGARVKDFRCNVRICNIESDSLASGGLDVDLGEYMLKAYTRVRKTGVRLAWYMPKSVYEYLLVKTRRDVKNSNFTFEDFEGKKILTFQGVPIYTEPALEFDEPAVTVDA